MQEISWPVLTQDQILAQQENLPEGEYNGEVTSAEFKISSTGNPMLKLAIQFHHNGREYRGYDNLVFVPKMMYKVKHFWESAGAPHFYDQGKCLERDFLGRKVICRTKLEKSQDGERMNIKIVDYIPREVGIKSSAPQSNQTIALNNVVNDAASLDDDIPF